MEIRRTAALEPLAQSAPSKPQTRSASPVSTLSAETNQLDTSSRTELTELAETPTNTQLSLALVDRPSQQDFTNLELTEIRHDYLNAPLELVAEMPTNVLLANQMVELEAGVTIKTSPEELREQQQNPVLFSYQGQTVEGFRLALSNGQSYFLAQNADATFYPNDPNLDILANTVEFRGGELTDMRGLSEAERQAVTGGF